MMILITTTNLFATVNKCNLAFVRFNQSSGSQFKEK